MRGALGEEIERIEDAAEARIRSERREQRLRADQLVEEILQLFLGHEEQTIPGEEIAAARNADRFEQIGALPEPFSERRRGVGSLVRGLAVDHDRQQIAMLRER